MKVYLGPFRRYISIYDLTSTLRFIGVSEDSCNALGEKLSDTFLGKFLAKINNSLPERAVRVRIDKYDTWNMDGTLAIIILPMLKQLQKTKHGAPYVDDNDVPQHLRSTSAPPKENEWDVDDNHFKRWDWVIDEIIWGFEQLQPDYDYMQQYMTGESDWEFKPIEGKEDLEEIVYGLNHTLQIDREGLKAHEARIDNSLRLFGIYFRNLWD